MTNRYFVVFSSLSLLVGATITWFLGYPYAACAVMAVSVFQVILYVISPVFFHRWRFFLEKTVLTFGTIFALGVFVIFYFLVMFPFSLVWKLSGKDDLRKKHARWRELSDQDNDPEGLRKLY